jgi:pilus assembly protein Flp/PilA
MNAFLANLYLRALAVRDREEGQAMAEYGIIIALVAVLLIGTLVVFKDALISTFTDISSRL